MSRAAKISEVNDDKVFQDFKMKISQKSKLHATLDGKLYLVNQTKSDYCQFLVSRLVP